MRSFASLAALAVLVGVLAACDQAASTAPPISQPSIETTTVPASPTAGSSATIEPETTPEDTATAGTPPCTLDVLKASHGLVEVAADARLTDLVLVSADTCSVGAFPALVLHDAGGAVLVSGVPLGSGGIDLVPGVAYTSQVTLDGWCRDEPAFPLSLGLLLDGHELAVTGESFPDDGDLPPCSGGGPTLQASAWEPTP